MGAPARPLTESVGGLRLEQCRNSQSTTTRNWGPADTVTEVTDFSFAVVATDSDDDDDACVLVESAATPPSCTKRASSALKALAHSACSGLLEL